MRDVSSQYHGCIGADLICRRSETREMQLNISHLFFLLLLLSRTSCYPYVFRAGTRIEYSSGIFSRPRYLITSPRLKEQIFHQRPVYTRSNCRRSTYERIRAGQRTILPSCDTLVIHTRRRWGEEEEERILGVRAFFSLDATGAPRRCADARNPFNSFHLGACAGALSHQTD